MLTSQMASDPGQTHPVRGAWDIVRDRESSALTDPACATIDEETKDQLHGMEPDTRSSETYADAALSQDSSMYQHAVVRNKRP
ncbi:hypothetical protein PMIN06_004786 [Paraphaeosphaeria minitans]